MARVFDVAQDRPRDHLMVVNISGRGDKDLATVAQHDGEALDGMT